MVPARFLADRYLEVALDGVAELRAVLSVIAWGPGPSVFHCASGKDRTGLVAALVLSMLGVADDDIVADFALTSLATERLVADWQALYPDRSLWPGFGRAPALAMRLFLAELGDRYGSVAGYVRSELGLDGDLVSALRVRLLD